MKKTKLVSVFLLLSVLSGLFCACRKPGDPPFSTGDWKTVMEVGGYNVPFDYYRYLFLNTKKTLDSSAGGYPEGKDKSEYINSLCIEDVKNAYAVFALAEDYELKLTEEDERQVELEINDEKSGYKNDGFEKELEAHFMDEDVLEFSYKLYYLEKRVFDYMTSETTNVIAADDDTLNKALAKDFVRIKQIVLGFDRDTRSAKKVLAEELLSKIKAGEDFETVRKEYSDDYSLTGDVDGYYFTHGEFELGQNFEDAAFALKENEMSGVVESTKGFHIIVRLPFEDSYIESHFEDLRKEYVTSRYYAMKKEKADSFEVEFKSRYEDFKYESME